MGFLDIGSALRGFSIVDTEIFVLTTSTVYMHDGLRSGFESKVFGKTAKIK